MGAPSQQDGAVQVPGVDGKGVPPARYGRPAQLMHWLTLALLAVLVPLGAILDDLPRVPATYAWYGLHKSLGATLFFLTCVRLAYRCRHPAPPLDSAMPAWQRRAAAAMHAALYLLLLALPLVGWMASQAGGHPLVWFGLVPMPAPVPASAWLNEQLHMLHSVLAWALVALLLLHVAAVVKHQFIDRDGTLARMLHRR